MYADDVAAILINLKCTVSVINSAMLAALEADGRGENRSDDGWDAANALTEWSNTDALRAAALRLANPLVLKSTALEEAGSSGGDDAELDRLAKLTPLDYDREREAAAKSLGVRVPTLDVLVKARREERSALAATALVTSIDPWDEAVNLREVLDEVRLTIHRFIICDPAVAVAAALWIAFTWIIDAVQIAPIAFITGPEKRCGKTRLLDLLGLLCRRALPTSNISPAATFRVIEASSPTLVIDEADSFFKENEELRGIINSGYTRTTAFVVRCVGEEKSSEKIFHLGSKGNRRDWAPERDRHGPLDRARVTPQTAPREG